MFSGILSDAIHIRSVVPWGSNTDWDETNEDDRKRKETHENQRPSREHWSLRGMGGGTIDALTSCDPSSEGSAFFADQMR